MPFWMTTKGSLLSRRKPLVNGERTAPFLKSFSSSRKERGGTNGLIKSLKKLDVSAQSKRPMGARAADPVKTQKRSQGKPKLKPKKNPVSSPIRNPAKTQIKALIIITTVRKNQPRLFWHLMSARETSTIPASSNSFPRAKARRILRCQRSCGAICKSCPSHQAGVPTRSRSNCFARSAPTSQTSE